MPGITITCYVDDIYINSNSPDDLQYFLRSFHLSTCSCGLVISSEKRRIFLSADQEHFRLSQLETKNIHLCTQYLYLSAPVHITAHIPARQRQHPIINDLLFQLERCLFPLKWLTNYTAGVSILVARTIYVASIRSVVDYLSSALVQLFRTVLQPLEKLQNKAMRLILGCPSSTRIANMQTELPLIERIYANVTCLSVRCLNSPHLAPHFSHILRAFLQPNASRHHL